MAQTSPNTEFVAQVLSPFAQMPFGHFTNSEYVIQNKFNHKEFQLWIIANFAKL